MPGQTDYDNIASRGKLVPNFIQQGFRQSAGETLTDTFIYTATRAVKLLGASLVQAVAGSDGGAVSLQLRKCTGTQAPSAGTALLTNNTNTGFDLKATANTVQSGALVASAASLTLAAGDRLALDVTGTPTAVAGVQVEIDLQVMATA
jgi:hypothetical protein